MHKIFPGVGGVGGPTQQVGHSAACCAAYIRRPFAEWLTVGADFCRFKPPPPPRLKECLAGKLSPFAALDGYGQTPMRCCMGPKRQQQACHDASCLSACWLTDPCYACICRPHSMGVFGSRQVRPTRLSEQAHSLQRVAEIVPHVLLACNSCMQRLQSWRTRWLL